MLTVGNDPSCSPLTIGTAACNSTPYQYPLTAEPANGVQSCIVGPWPFPTHDGPVYPAAPTLAPSPQPTYHYHFTAPLSDADVDRIARRVVELLREDKP